MPIPPPPPLLPAPRDEVLDFCLISVAMALGLLANSDSLQKWEKEREREWNGVGRRVGIRKGLRGMSKGQERGKRREEKHFNIYLSYTLSKRNVGIGCRCGMGVGVMVVAAGAAVIWLRHACV